MTTRRKQLGAALLFGLGAALLASAFTSTPVAAGPPLLLCSASDSGSPTGRQFAKITQSPRDPSKCVREKLGGVAPPGFPDCWKAAGSAGFGCVEVIDIN